MLDFISSFKAMMVVFDISDNSELFQFLKTQQSRDFRPIAKKLELLGYDGQVFKNILPTCGCSSNSPSENVMPIISAKTSKGENFCFHRPIDKLLLTQYSQLRSFLLENVIFLFPIEEIAQIKRMFKPVSAFEKPLEFKACPCLRNIHGVADFHNMRFPGFYFSPAMVMMGSILSRVDFRKCMLDLTKFGISDDFLNIAKSAKESDEEISSDYAADFEAACNQYERKLLSIQGLINDPKLSHLPNLFKLVKLEEFEDKMTQHADDSLETLSDSDDESDSPINKKSERSVQIAGFAQNSLTASSSKNDSENKQGIMVLKRLFNTIFSF